MDIGLNCFSTYDHPDRRAWHHSESNKTSGDSRLVQSNGNIYGESYKLKDFIIAGYALLLVY